MNNPGRIIFLPKGKSWGDIKKSVMTAHVFIFVNYYLALKYKIK